MKKRLIAMILLAALCTAMSGCASMFEKEYLAVTEYQGEVPDDSSETSIEVKGFYSLKSAITRLVNSHADYGELEFRNYDGDISADLAEACWQVKSDTPYGAYAVDYMSYEVRHIVSYYTADIYITYKHTKAETDRVLNIGGDSSLYDLISEALSKADDHMLVWVTNGTVTAETVKNYVQEAYYSQPLGSVILPAVEVSIYPDSGIQRIFEISFNYGYRTWELIEMQEQLADAADTVAASVRTGPPANMALSLCQTLSELCVYEPEEQPDGKKVSALRDTAYGVLLEKRATGEGFAMAYKALCDMLGIPCQVVLGRLDKATHAWNIIELDGEYYHVDVSQCASTGVGASFLNDDSDMWGRYWWDIENYPACEGELNYYSLTPVTEAPQTSDEPEISEN
jgi:hypothetical protein